MDRGWRGDCFAARRACVVSVRASVDNNGDGGGGNDNNNNNSTKENDNGNDGERGDGRGEGAVDEAWPPWLPEAFRVNLADVQTVLAAFFISLGFRYEHREPKHRLWRRYTLKSRETRAQNR